MLALAGLDAGNPLPEGEGRVRGRPVDALAVTSPQPAVSLAFDWSRGLHLTPAPLLTGEGFPARFAQHPRAPMKDS